jgi:predicted acyltransferase
MAGQGEIPSKKRLASLDILRGADLFLLLFLGPVIHNLCDVYPDGTTWLARQCEHVAWEGFAPWDLIMPLFLFMSGMTIPFSMARYRNGVKPDGQFYLKLLRRFFLLFLLGWIVQGNLLDFNWKTFHPYANTLQAIAVGYVVAALLFVHFDFKWQAVFTVALFAGYWIAFACTGMNLDGQGNVAMVVDKAILGSHRGGVLWSPDGSWRFSSGYEYTWILSSLNFAVTVLLGSFAGQMLASKRFQPSKRAALVAVAGAGLIAAGLAMSPVFPIIKKIWSSSMTLCSGGICFLFIALTYYLVDVRGWHKGADWLKIYGMNAITAYTVGMVVRFSSVSESLLHGFSGFSWYPVLIALSNSSILFFILWLMYRNRIFLRV